ncbi:MAG TPA: hypothetical protein VG329_02285 [Candidatus Dormibacteraeota bacterium]|nr:hypothetical protein [Candidatus Dormibacteraeota bacterium]
MSTPPASPKTSPHPTSPGGGGGGGGSGGGGGGLPNIGGVIQPGSSDNIVGSVPPPPAPPNVQATSLDVNADPANPTPGQQATLTITASGNHGVDKYGVKDVQVNIELSKSPGSDAKVDPTTATTDASGTAVAKFTASKTKGLHSITISAGTLTTQFNVDTLVGSSGVLVRGRHSGNLDPSLVTAPAFNPLLIFAIAAAAVVLGFLVPYRRRLGDLWPRFGGIFGGRRGKPEGYGEAGAAETEVWGTSSPRKSRVRP